MSDVSFRDRRALLALAVAGSLAVIVATAEAQTAPSPVVALPAWTHWLQVVVNLLKVFELWAFAFGAYQFWAGRRERKQADTEAAERAIIDSNYQAWQVINSAQGKGGSGGRIEALRDLLKNGVSLAGINLDEAWLEGVELQGATLTRSSLRGARLRNAKLAGANLEGADLTGADLMGADLSNAILRSATITDATLATALLDGAELAELTGWASVRSLSHASIEGVRRAPEGFVAHARALGAVDSATAPALQGDALSYSTQFRAI